METNMHGAVYEGSIPGAFGDRKPPSSAYATFSPILYMDKKGTFVGGNFWDGRATGEILGSPAAEQAKGPFLNPRNRHYLQLLNWLQKSAPQPTGIFSGRSGEQISAILRM